MTTRQDKATTDRHAKTLRELVKTPSNKLCGDCKRNDARWASWNIGVFICIRCSGIHRSMGTHISKVKSVDLDVWTPEQMTSIQKWGNTRANLYWEAHLKPGHQPPDHKMDSFIRSKYESRRWAMEGPPPNDPSTLERNGEASVSNALPTTQQNSLADSSVSQRTSGSTNATAPAAPVTTASAGVRIMSPPKTHNLLSSAHGHTSSTSSIPSSTSTLPTPAPAPTNDLFSLDFSAAPTPAPSTNQKKDVKQDILSLFSSAPPPPPPSTAPAAGIWGQPVPASNPPPPTQPWGQTQVANTSSNVWGQPAQVGWGAEPAVWGTPVGAPAASSSSSGADPWGNQFGLNNSTSSQNVWATAAPVQNTSNAFGTQTAAVETKKQDDAFGDLWGAFK